MEFQARRSHFLHFPHVAKVALPACRAVVMQTREHTHTHTQMCPISSQHQILTFPMPRASELSWDGCDGLKQQKKPQDSSKVMKSVLEKCHTRFEPVC